MLKKQFRDQFLQKTKISETDNLYFYDYAIDKLILLKVSDLNVVAVPDIYISKNDWPFSQHDYMIGFEINKKSLLGFVPYYSNTLVSIGQKNPFITGHLTRIKWDSIDSTSFPSEAILDKTTRYFKENEYKIGQCYSSKSNNLDYYVQDLVNDKWLFAKRLIVLGTKSKELVYETMYYSSEGSSFASPDNQWTGLLFKNMPAVIFGFTWQSFSCQAFDVLAPEATSIPINCDCRH